MAVDRPKGHSRRMWYKGPGWSNVDSSISEIARRRTRCCDLLQEGISRYLRHDPLSPLQAAASIQTDPRYVELFEPIPDLNPVPNLSSISDPHHSSMVEGECIPLYTLNPQPYMEHVYNSTYVNACAAEDVRYASTVPHGMCIDDEEGHAHARSVDAECMQAGSM